MATSASREFVPNHWLSLVSLRAASYYLHSLNARKYWDILPNLVTGTMVVGSRADAGFPFRHRFEAGPTTHVVMSGGAERQANSSADRVKQPLPKRVVFE
jgi:hypothetical protein